MIEAQISRAFPEYDPAGRQLSYPWSRDPGEDPGRSEGNETGSAADDSRHASSIDNCDPLSMSGASGSSGDPSPLESAPRPSLTNLPNGGDLASIALIQNLERAKEIESMTMSADDFPVRDHGIETTRPKKLGSMLPSASDATQHLKLSEDSHKRRRSQVDANPNQDHERDKVLKLSPAKIQELATSPDSLPIRALTPELTPPPQALLSDVPSVPYRSQDKEVLGLQTSENESSSKEINGLVRSAESRTHKTVSVQDPSSAHDRAEPVSTLSSTSRPPLSSRALSTPATVRRRRSPSRQDLTLQKVSQSKSSRNAPGPLQLDNGKSNIQPQGNPEPFPSPMPPSIPLPPISIPTYLQLELSSHRPSPLYIHRSATSDFPYESSRVKIERLMNFLLLPPHLEQVLWFGALACLDSWLYSFTILPLRFLKAVGILSHSWLVNIMAEIHFVLDFTLKGTGRMWRRRWTRGVSASTNGLRSLETASLTTKDVTDLDKTTSPDLSSGAERFRSSSGRPDLTLRPIKATARRHRRNKSVPSALLPDDKADILKGFLILSTCMILMYFDASRMYHWIRGQAAIKLYVIYNVLEVGDRLFSAIGQDVLECLFSREALERKPDGRSKVLRPFWLFVLALVYTVIHSTSLFYQVITLNVAVNSYSNALITLLMSNQFVEIKSTVFKKFEKENLFQLTCADVVERFQLWLMLIIIASRNIVETGGLSMGFSALASSSSSTSYTTASNFSNPLITPARSATSILPKSFTILPGLFSSLTAYAPTAGHVLGPFLVVLGSEMLVDWLKHAYINKFNNTRPAVYGRFLDVLAKDYYSNAFADQNLTKRLGLPVIPLSCLFIRASVQTYHMLLAAWVPAEALIPSSVTGLSSMHEHYSSSSAFSSSPTSVVTSGFDYLLHRAMSIPIPSLSTNAWVNVTTLLVFLLIYLVLLALKIVLGMLLLAFARSRYRGMKERERNPIHHVEGGKRVGGWGVVEVDEDKRRWIYDGDEEGLRALRERERREEEKRKKEGLNLEVVKRYEMVAKRIW